MAKSDWPEWAEVVAMGHEVGSHSMTHAKLRSLSSSELEEELGGAKAALRSELGLGKGMTFAYPYGAYNSTVVERTRHHYLAARRVGGGLNPKSPANLHLLIGKTSFSEEDLMANLTAAIEAINRAKPTGAKGTYIRRVTLAPTMGPGIRLDPVQASALHSL